MKLRNYIPAIILILLPAFQFAQNATPVNIQWESPASIVMGNDTSIFSLSFKNAQFTGLPENILPAYTRRIPLEKGKTVTGIKLSGVKYVPFTETDKQLLAGTQLPSTIQTEFFTQSQNGKPEVRIHILPFGFDTLNGQHAKVSSFTYEVITKNAPLVTKNATAYSANSVLSMGDWYKFYITESGIYRLTFDDLRNMGVKMDGLNPDMIRIFGNGGVMLDEVAGAFRHDDLAENAIRVVNATPGVFKQGDYVLFYGQGTLGWKKNPFSTRIDHITHPYADQAAYFLTIGPIAGKRIAVDNSNIGSPNYTTNAFTATKVYEKDLVNLMKSGRRWFGEKLDFYNRSFNLPRYTFNDYIPGEDATVRYGLAGRSLVSRIYFNILSNNDNVANTSFSAIGKYDYAFDITTVATFKPTGPNIDLQLAFTPSGTNDLGWLDFMALNVRCYLKFNGGQLAFRDPKSVGPERITTFTMDNALNNLEIWDVTDPVNVQSVNINKQGNQYQFKRSTDSLVEMLAFDGSSFFTIIQGEKVRNQNLHSTGNYDMIVVTAPEFKSQAARIAKAHNDLGDVSTVVVSLPDIYNEFSSGIQDITAIRDFMKMLYDRGQGSAYPKYLLLVGNASYDVKNRIPDNSNFVPTYESPNSVKETLSYLSDDYYGLLDDGEGEDTKGLLDIGVGRLPVRTTDQANAVTDKLVYYINNAEATHGDWRNTIIVPADDEDSNTHFKQAEKLVDSIEKYHPIYNIEKIYFDAFKQVSTPGGNRYPDVNREIASRVEKGAMLVNYIGHGGEVGWAHERVLEISDILGWNNYNQMGLFFTATCEFSRFDNPAHTSAGELVLLNENGGAIALITTTRLAYASNNEVLNLSFIDTALNITEDYTPRLGDIIKYTKNGSGNSANTRHLTLFGDPSMSMAIPRHKVITTSITDALTGEPTDTLSANSRVTVSGELRSASGAFMPDFNGTVYMKLFDKPSKVKTLGQDPGSRVAEFTVQKNIIYQGKASVVNGAFSITFPIPLDIEYNFGHGKLSYYATDGVDDAAGFFTDFTVGGSNSQAHTDITGPQIRLFVNDSNFVNGDLTSEFPRLTAFLYDESGINTVGNSIGHDILATLDGDSYSSVALNDFYVADLDSYKSGVVKYQYFNLAEGEHTLTLKAWDVFNNSGEATINFTVKRNIRLDIDEAIAYPNPSGGDVWFRFGHNLFDGTLDIEMNIFSTSGEMVRVVGPFKVVSEGFLADRLYWDGRLANGSKARAGLYLCRIKVRDRNGYISSSTAKVIIAR